MSDVAEFDVFCPGVLDVLSIGKGDMRLQVGDSAEDRERAKTLIEEMLQKGYSIFVETDKGPVRVKRFNPKRMTYIILDDPEPAKPEKATAAKAPTKKAAKKTAKAVEKEVPVKGSKATAVGRTAGG